MAECVVRISRAIWGHLEGSQAYADWWSMHCGHEPSGQSRSSEIGLFARLDLARQDSRGTRTVTITDDQLRYLESSVGAMLEGARDNLGAWDEDNWALRDFNAARAFMRQVERLRELGVS
jgi:hypothetical protein